MAAPSVPGTPDAALDLPFRRILLVGFMGSGKTTVGPLLAAELGWRHVDLDREIERKAGRTIPRIFQEDGEEAFRELEGEAGREALGWDGVVVTPGGGWPCRPGRMEALDPETLSIWLRVSPETALERATGQGATVRPLLAGADPLGRARELVAARERFYAAARWQVDTEGRAPADVVRIVTDRLRGDPTDPLTA